VVNVQNFYYLLDRNRIQSGPAILCVHCQRSGCPAKYTLFAGQTQGSANFLGRPAFPR